MTSSSIKVIAGLVGLSGIALGAFGAHALKALLIERGMLSAWQTAVQYHLIHAVSLLAVAYGVARVGRVGAVITLSWALGVLLFSGSLYWMAVGGPRWLGPITPLGGVAFLVGWGAVIFAGIKERNKPNQGGRE